MARVKIIRMSEPAVEVEVPEGTTLRSIVEDTLRQPLAGLSATLNGSTPVNSGYECRHGDTISLYPKVEGGI